MTVSLQTVCPDVAAYNVFPNIAYSKVVKGTNGQIFSQITDGKDYQIQWVINRAWEFVVVDFTTAEKLGVIRIKLKADISTYGFCCEGLTQNILVTLFGDIYLVQY